MPCSSGRLPDISFSLHVSRKLPGLGIDALLRLTRVQGQVDCLRLLSGAQLSDDSGQGVVASHPVC